MTEAPITSDEWVILSWFFEIGWDDSSLPELRSLGAGEQDKIPRLQNALRPLLDRGCLGIKRTNDDRVNEVFLTIGEARVVIDDATSWTAPYDPGFDGSGDFFVAVPTDAADRVFQAAVDEGRALLEFESIALT